MAISPASPEPPGFPGPTGASGSTARGRADSLSARRHISRWVIRVLLLAAALLAISTPAYAATHAPHATQAAATAHASRAASAGVEIASKAAVSSSTRMTQREM